VIAIVGRSGRSGEKQKRDEKTRKLEKKRKKEKVRLQRDHIETTARPQRPTHNSGKKNTLYFPRILFG